MQGEIYDGVADTRAEMTASELVDAVLGVLY